MGKEDCQTALSSSSSNGRAAQSQHLMGNERTTTERTGAGFPFVVSGMLLHSSLIYLWVSKKQFQFQGASDGNLALRGSETGV